jgi:hypothetical protein
VDVDVEKPRVQPLDPPMVPFAVIGTAVWAAIGLALLPFRGWLHDHGHTNWLWTCLAGVLLGIPGLYLMIRHDRHRQARRLRARQAETPRVDEG